MGVLVYWLLNGLCVLGVIDIKSRVPVKKPHCVSDFSKVDALLHETHIKVLLVYTKVPRLDMYRSILSLIRIAH